MTQKDSRKIALKRYPSMAQDVNINGHFGLLSPLLSSLHTDMLVLDRFALEN